MMYTDACAIQPQSSIIVAAAAASIVVATATAVTATAIEATARVVVATARVATATVPALLRQEIEILLEHCGLDRLIAQLEGRDGLVGIRTEKAREGCAPQEELKPLPLGFRHRCCHLHQLRNALFGNFLKEGLLLLRGQILKDVYRRLWRLEELVRPMCDGQRICSHSSCGGFCLQQRSLVDEVAKRHNKARKKGTEHVANQTM